MADYIEKIALVGATGQVGKHILQNLVDTGKHVTVITREGSSGTFPSSVTVKKVDYSSHDSLVQALQGQQVLIITMAATAPPETEQKLVEAAAAAGVSWIMPNHWGIDTISNKKLGEDVFLGPKKLKLIEKIEELGMSWIALTSGFWYEFSLGGTADRYGFDFKSRTVILFDGGDVPINTSTWELTGKAVAKLLSLKINGGSPSLTGYRNKNVYISSFRLTQKDMLESVKRVTGEEWKVEHESAEKRYKDGVQKMQSGDFTGFVKLLYSRVFYSDDCGDFEKTHGLDNQALGLQKEDLDACTQKAIKGAHEGAYT